VILYFNQTSPYARKARVTAHEKDLIARMDLREVDPWADPAALHDATPIGKVPALVTDDGVLVTESMTIAEYLDAAGDGPALMPGDRLAVMAHAALAQGLIDAAFGIVMEQRRPVERQWAVWTHRQRRAIDRTLLRVAVPPAGRFDLGDIALACGLAYVDFRLPETPWRKARPELAAWLDRVSARPSMQATRP
jgi:glutathione S-transferase